MKVYVLDRNDYQLKENELQEGDCLNIEKLSALGNCLSEMSNALLCLIDRNVSLSLNDKVADIQFLLTILNEINSIQLQEKEMYQKNRMEGIRRALEKKKSGEGTYGRPRVIIPDDFKKQILLCRSRNIPLDVYRRKLKMKRSTFYKYAREYENQIEKGEMYKCNGE